MKPKYLNKDDYTADLLRLVKLESYIDSLKERQFFKSNFRFDPSEQRTITRRIILELRG